MPRTKTGTKRTARHKKIRRQAKGFKGHRGHSFRGAKEGLMHAQQHAYRDRRRKKREMRRLWITRINGALNKHHLPYSEFINHLKTNNIQLDRKVLSRIAVHDPATFTAIVQAASPSQDQAEDQKDEN